LASDAAGNPDYQELAATLATGFGMGKAHAGDSGPGDALRLLRSALQRLSRPAEPSPESHYQSARVHAQLGLIGTRRAASLVAPALERPATEFAAAIASLRRAASSSAPGFRWTSRWDIIHVQTQEPTPMSNTPNLGERGRFSAPREAATVLRLLRGESLELLARELGVTAATLAGWRDDFLAGGQAALKSRPADYRDEEIARLRAKVGELTMDNELLLQRRRGDHPFVPRRRKK
jgi:transposase-like protein